MIHKAQINGGGTGPPFRHHLDDLDRQITLLGTGGVLTAVADRARSGLTATALVCYVHFKR